MIDSSPLPIVPESNTRVKYAGDYQGSGKAHLQLLGAHDAASRQLHDHVVRALAVFPMPCKMSEVSEPTAIAASGTKVLPALLIDGQLLVEGRVPTVEELIELFRNRPLLNSKLYRLRNMAIAVDISRGSASALRFAWHIAQKVGATLEVVYVMDSIFDGHLASDSGFLSGYQHTMQAELDVFIWETMAQIGVKYEPLTPGAPNQPSPQSSPLLHSKVMYGFPDAALVECSRQVDLLVMGSTGQGALGKKVFGSVSTEVSLRAHCPVLLVPPDAEFRGLQNLLYASNFDSFDTLRIKQALSFAQRFKRQVHFVHVGTGSAKGIALKRELFEASYRDSHPEQPFLFYKIVNDDVVAGLYEYALLHQIEMLVFVTHQRSFWENILHRSTIREATTSTNHLPILVIHSDNDML